MDALTGTLKVATNILFGMDASLMDRYGHMKVSRNSEWIFRLTFHDRNPWLPWLYTQPCSTAEVQRLWDLIVPEKLQVLLCQTVSMLFPPFLYPDLAMAHGSILLPTFWAEQALRSSISPNVCHTVPVILCFPWPLSNVECFCFLCLGWCYNTLRTATQWWKGLL